MRKENISRFLQEMITYNDSNIPLNCTHTRDIHIGCNDIPGYSSDKLSFSTICREYILKVIFCNLKFAEENVRCIEKYRTDLFSNNFKERFDIFRLQQHVTSSFNNRYCFKMSIIMYLHTKQTNERSNSREKLSYSRSGAKCSNYYQISKSISMKMLREYRSFLRW